jgi:glycosyltransferase involved in cell wall biosynthesis
MIEPIKITDYRRKILAYMPTFNPEGKVEDSHARPLVRLNMDQIADRINTLGAKSRNRPWVYLDCIDSVINQRPDVDLVVADARSSDGIRVQMALHHKQARGYQLAFYPDKLSQWAVFNDILQRHSTHETEFFIYTSSDIIWAHDWVAEALKEFDADPKLQILFPTVSTGDNSIPIQISSGPHDAELIDPADHMNCVGMEAARAPTLNAYAIMFRMEFLREYGGYQTAWLNCFSESFLYYLAEAMGGKMRLMPRGWCYHHNGVDLWISEKGFYGYSSEKPLFDEIMDKVQAARISKTMTPEFLKDLLWRKTA